MNQRIGKAIVQGALITAVYGVLAIINLYTGSLFDILLCYIMVLPMTWYTKEYSMKESLVVIFASGVILLLVSQVFFVFYSIPTLLMGIFYGEALKRKLSTGTTYLGLLVISAIKNYVIFFILGSMLGVSLETEGIEIYQLVFSVLPGLQNILTGRMVFYFLWILIFIFEASIVKAYSNLFLNRIIKKK